MHERKILVRYLAEFLAALALYAVTLVGSIDIANHLRKGPAQTAVVLVPMIPFVLMLVVLARSFRRADEYVRLKLLEHVAIVAAVTAGWTFTYGFLEGVGCPRLSMFTVWPIMCATAVALTLVRAVLRR